MAAEIDGGRTLEQFPEIVDAGADDEQATQCIGHCVESVALDKKDIGEGDDGIGKEKDIVHLICAAAIDDLAEHIQIKGELYYGGNVAELGIIDLGDSEVILHPGKEADEQKKEGKIPQPALGGGKEKDRQAGKEGNRGGDRDNIYQITGRIEKF